MIRRSLVPALALTLVQCRPPKDGPPEPPTFNRDVGPILFTKCAPCHHGAGSAPFPLLAYEDAKKRASQIAQITSDRYMPPWLPETGLVAYADDRSLAPDQIDVIRRWVDSGALEGDPGDLPPRPAWRDEWELGEPDLVLTMEPYVLAAEGPDVFRNFVVPTGTTERRYVRAFEFRPGSRAVHHAALLIDETRSSRNLDARDPENGIDGMVLGSKAAMPDGHFLGWTPGKRPYQTPEGMSWTLPPRSDLVLHLHMTRTGKAETVRASVGFFFGEDPPERRPFVVRLGSRRIDVAPGERSYAIRDSYEIPVDVRALSVYPHAHYLAKEMTVRARLPDGGEQSLLHIPDWDFKWQDVFRYAAPVRLPRGSVVSMDFRYDNSEENPRNPYRPPRRVKYGPQSTDEMGDVYLEVLPERSDQYEMLVRDFLENDREKQIVEIRAHLAETPGDADARNSLAVLYDSLDRVDEAMVELRTAVGLDPSLALARFNLGSLLLARGRLDEAVAELRKAAELAPGDAETRVRLGNALRDRGQLEAAERELERALEIDPDDGWGRYSLALVYQLRGRIENAIEEYRQALVLRPEDPELLVSYGAALASVGRTNEAAPLFEKASRLAPDWPEPRRRLAEIGDSR